MWQKKIIQSEQGEEQAHSSGGEGGAVLSVMVHEASLPAQTVCGLF